MIKIMFPVENSHSSMPGPGLTLSSIGSFFMSGYHHLNFSEFRADELAGYISDKHHSFTRRIAENILERLNQLMGSEERGREEYRHLRNLCDMLFSELNNHMRKEETILFPFIRKMVQTEQGQVEKEFPAVTMVKNPIDLLLREHRRISLLLQEIRVTTHNYKPAEERSTYCKLCLSELFDLDQDIQKHFYLEETVLYPKLLALEESIAAARPDSGIIPSAS